jgi:hypothetical protein
MRTAQRGSRHFLRILRPFPGMDRREGRPGGEAGGGGRSRGGDCGTAAQAVPAPAQCRRRTVHGGAVQWDARESWSAARTATTARTSRAAGTTDGESRRTASATWCEEEAIATSSTTRKEVRRAATPTSTAGPEIRTATPAASRGEIRAATSTATATPAASCGEIRASSSSGAGRSCRPVGVRHARYRPRQDFRRTRAPGRERRTRGTRPPGGETAAHGRAEDRTHPPAASG